MVELLYLFLFLFSLFLPDVYLLLHIFRVSVLKFFIKYVIQALAL